METSGCIHEKGFSNYPNTTIREHLLIVQNETKEPIP